MSLNVWIDELGGELATAADRTARRPPRRAPLLVAATLAAAVVVAVAIALGGAADDEREAAPAPAPPHGTVPADRVLERDPYMGVACPVPNSIACDRVGLDVDLREPALAVEARIGERSFALEDEEWSGPQRADGARDHFAGFLQPAGLSEPGPLHVPADADGRWLGGEGPGPVRVELTVTRPGGKRVRTELTVHLSAGWG